MCVSAPSPRGRESTSCISVALITMLKRSCPSAPSHERDDSQATVELDSMFRIQTEPGDVIRALLETTNGVGQPSSSPEIQAVDISAARGDVGTDPLGSSGSRFLLEARRQDEHELVFSQACTSF